MIINCRYMGFGGLGYRMYVRFSVTCYTVTLWNTCPLGKVPYVSLREHMFA